jgi:hypothetical protein
MLRGIYVDINGSQSLDTGKKYNKNNNNNNNNKNNV